jgi:hypothetical protein
MRQKRRKLAQKYRRWRNMRRARRRIAWRQRRWRKINGRNGGAWRLRKSIGGAQLPPSRRGIAARLAHQRRLAA